MTCSICASNTRYLAVSPHLTQVMEMAATTQHVVPYTNIIEFNSIISLIIIRVETTILRPILALNEKFLLENFSWTI